MLLDSLAGAEDVTVCRLDGNLGDHLIDAGTERLLTEVPHQTVWRHGLEHLEGDLLVINGSGGWCSYWWQTIRRTLDYARGFERVIVFPSTFELAEPIVRNIVETTDASPLFAREQVSYEDVYAVRPDVYLAHDPAFFLDYGSYRRAGRGVLKAFRTDKEREREHEQGSVDISLTCSSLEDWLGWIADAKEVHTDRAHVMIAAALMGKTVRYAECGYFKVGALARTWLGDYDVEPL